eukprot:6056066-Pyramimonas_sp.AAC.1
MVGTVGTVGLWWGQWAQCDSTVGQRWGQWWGRWWWGQWDSGEDSGDSGTVVGTVEQLSGTAVRTVGTVGRWWGQLGQWDSGGDSGSNGESGTVV